MMAIGPCFSGTLFAGPEVCGTGGGPSVCVRFDNLPTTPIEGTDYAFDLDVPSAPSVRLLRGENSPGSLYEWRVWSKNAQGAAANLGSITSPGAYNYDVKVVSPDDLIGAANAGAITLTPPGDHYANITNIGLNELTGDLTVQPNSAGVGGEVATFGVGSVSGRVTIHKLIYPGMGTGPVSGTIAIDQLETGITTTEVSGTLTVTNATTAAGGAFVRPFSPISGSVTVSEIAAATEVFAFFNPGGIAETGVVTFGNIIGPVDIKVGDSPEDEPVAGTLRFLAGVNNGIAQVSGELTSTGVVDLNGAGVTATGQLIVAGGGPGNIVNGGTISGVVQLGGGVFDGLTAEFTGHATFAAATAGASLELTGAGVLEVTGTFDGDLCGPGVSPTTPLPSNIQIGEFGPNGKLCGQLVCGGPLSSEAGNPPIRRTRFAAFKRPGAALTAIQVTLLDLQNPVPANAPCCPPPNFSTYEAATCTAPGEQNGCVRWVGPPDSYLYYQGLPWAGDFRASRLQCTPFYYDWGAETLAHIMGSEVLPSSSYELRLVPLNGAQCANALTLNTARHGDIARSFNPPDASDQPDALDIAAAINTFKGVAGAVAKYQAQVQPNLPDVNGDLNAIDIGIVVDAAKGFAYPFSGPCPCPSRVPCDKACNNTQQCQLCSGGSNIGAYCTSDEDCDASGDCSNCCSGAARGTCVKVCTGGVNAGQACGNDTHCNRCLGGTYDGLPCAPGSGPCPGGVCGADLCSVGDVGQPCAVDDDCDVTRTCNLDGSCRDVNGVVCGICSFPGIPVSATGSAPAPPRAGRVSAATSADDVIESRFSQPRP
jgi:hypothetical protein